MQSTYSALQNWFNSFTTADVAGVAVTVFLTLLAILVLRLGLPRLLSRLSRNQGWEFDNQTWVRLVTPLWLIVLFFGVWALLTQIPVPDDLAERYHRGLNLGVSLLIIVVVLMGLLRGTRAITDHYRNRLTAVGDPRSTYVGAIRKLVNIVILVIGFIVLVGQLGYEITPLLASLGVAGLAVALALQDTLSNLFAASTWPSTGPSPSVSTSSWTVARRASWKRSVGALPASDPGTTTAFSSPTRSSRRPLSLICTLAIR